MAGGNFLGYNKVRAGAYINFKQVAKPLSSIGRRGVVAFCTALSWSDTVTEITADEFVEGRALAKIGYGTAAPEVQLFREALKNAHKAIIYRLDTGGNKATKAFNDLTVTAKYAGTVGNKIAVEVVSAASGFDVNTYFDGIIVDSQNGATIGDLTANDWVDFVGTAGNALQAGTITSLVGGTNGTIGGTAYADFMNAIKSRQWDVMGIPAELTTEKSDVETFIRGLRDTQGRKVQAVLYDAGTDYEGIISVKQGYKTEFEEISPTSFVVYAAGLAAGTPVGVSNTYHEITGATAITYPIGTDPYDNDDIETALANGEMVISTRQDGVIVIEQDINTLHSFTADKGYIFSKNRVIRTLDDINNSIGAMFEKGYIGKVNNDENGRNIFKADVVVYLTELQRNGAIQNFDSTTDIAVQAGTTIDSLIVDLAVQPTDAMEKLYMTVQVG